MQEALPRTCMLHLSFLVCSGTEFPQVARVHLGSVKALLRVLAGFAELLLGSLMPVCVLIVYLWLLLFFSFLGDFRVPFSLLEDEVFSLLFVLCACWALGICKIVPFSSGRGGGGVLPLRWFVPVSSHVLFFVLLRIPLI